MISLTSPIETWAHRWPAGLKLAGLSVSTIAMFYLNTPLSQAVVLAIIVTLYALPGRVFLTTGLKRLTMLWPFVLIVGAYHIITWDIAAGAVIILRLISAVALANLVTMTTRLTDMIDVVHWLATPLRAFGLTTRALEIAIALVVRMTPVLLGKAQALSRAWRARSRRRVSWRIVLPFTLLVIDDADYLSQALKARGGFIPEEET